MWPRVVEVMLGVWLLVTPFVFGYEAGDRAAFISDYVCATLIITFGCMSYHRRFAGAHFLTCAVALWMMGYSYLVIYPLNSASAANGLLVGLTLLLFAVLPNHVNDEPRAWASGRGA